MSNSVEKINKININNQNRKKANNINSFNNIKKNKNDIDYITNNSQRNADIKRIIVNNKNKNNSQLNKNIRNNFYNFSSSEYNQKIYPNLRINNLYNRKENLIRKKNTQDTLSSDITYKRQVNTEIDDIDYTKPKTSQYLKKYENEDILKKKKPNDINENPFSYMKNTSNYLCSNKNTIPQNIELNNNNTLLNTKTQLNPSFNKVQKRNEIIRYNNNPRKNNKNYVSPWKQSSSLFEYNRLPQKLNLFGDEYSITNPNLLNNNLNNLNNQLGLFSNSVEKKRITDYKSTFTKSNYDYPLSLYNTNYNSINNSKISKNLNSVYIPRRANENYLTSNNSYDDNLHNKNYQPYIRHTKYNKLIKKGIIDNSNKNINNQFNYRVPMQTNSSLYNNKNITKYLSHYNFIDNKIDNKINGFNRTQDLHYNYKINNINTNNISNINNNNLRKIIFNNNIISYPNNDIIRNNLEPKSSNEENVYGHILNNRYNNNNNIYKTINVNNIKNLNDHLFKINKTFNNMKYISENINQLNNAINRYNKYKYQKSLKEKNIPFEIRKMKIDNMSPNLTNEITERYLYNNHTLDNLNYFPNSINPRLSTDGLMKKIEGFGKTVDHIGKGNRLLMGRNYNIYSSNNNNYYNINHYYNNSNKNQ
jgi:hypothetical protein